MSLQDDWLAYMQDPTLYDRYHFSPLITDTEEPLDLDAAFSGIKNGAELIRRVRRVIDENDFTGMYYVPRLDNRLSRDSLLDLAKDYAETITSRLVSLGEASHARTIRDNTVEIVYEADIDIEKERFSLGDSDVFWIISDDFADVAATRGIPYFYGLKEAVLFMTKVPEVTRYILNALVDYPVNDEIAYELWKGGARVDFYRGKTLIVVED